VTDSTSGSKLCSLGLKKRAGGLFSSTADFFLLPVIGSRSGG